MSQEKKYDIFISYRRRGGFHIAKLLYYSLTNDRYKVSFLDHGLSSFLDGGGMFLNEKDLNRELMLRIDSCKDMIVVLDKDAFGPTLCGLPKDMDWLRKELNWAIEKKKNIIPIFLDGVEMVPWKKLPEDIRYLREINGLDCPKEKRFYNIFLEELKKSFLSKPEIESKYVFLSHSHHDFDKVCQLRNLLEAEGFKPLMFFLKAFEKPEYEPMLKPILKEEIDQRERFILCRSENSRKSEWVKFEENYIKSKERPYEVVDLESSEKLQLDAIKLYKQRCMVFVSYPQAFQYLFNLKEELNNSGFQTWIDINDLIAESKTFIEKRFNIIDKAAQEGYMLFLIDSDNLRDDQKQELEYALTKSEVYNRKYIIPIWVSGKHTHERLKGIFDVRDLPEEEQVGKIVKYLIEYDLQFNVE